MKKATNKTGNVEEHKVYRYVQQLGQRLDLLVKQSTDWKELFEPEPILLRQRLSESCENLMTNASPDLARKAEEYLWRRVFYDVIQALKQDKKALALETSLTGAYSLHLDGAIGFYHHLLAKLKQSYPLLSTQNATSQPLTEEQDKTDILSWATKAYQRCLIYLGDLARYLIDVNGSYCASLAERYYHQAILSYPQNGMPHNQLGTLYIGQDRILEAGYHYMRCLVADQSFEGARENLRRLFDKNRVAFQDVSANNNQAGLSEKEVFCMGFLHLEEYLFGFNVVKANDLSELCQFIVNGCHNMLSTSLQQLLVNPQSDSNSSGIDNILSPVFMVKMYAMCIMNIIMLQSKGSDLASASVSFLLTMISRLLDHAHNCITIATKNNIALSDKHNGHPAGSHGADLMSTVVEDKKRRVKLSIRKRRRSRHRPGHCHSFDDENDDSDNSQAHIGDDDNNKQYDDDEDLSEDDLYDTNESSSLTDSDWYLSSEDETTTSPNQSPTNNDKLRHKEQIKLESLANAAAAAALPCDETKPKLENGFNTISLPVATLEKYHTGLKSMDKYGYLSVVNAVCMWLFNNKDLLSACSTSMPTILQTFADLLNELPSDELLSSAVTKPHKRNQQTHCYHQLNILNTKENQQSLYENVALYGLQGLPPFHVMPVAVNVNDLPIQSDINSIATRIIQLKSTGQSLVNNEECQQFSFNSTQKVFTFDPIAQPPTPVSPTADNDKSTYNQRTSNTKDVMQNMARQKLEFELTELESALKSSSVETSRAISPYLVVDAPALYRHLSFLRSLSKSGEFIIIVPSVVISALDDLKKYNQGAREAIRFLEEEFKHGNKWLRAQKDHETSSDSIVGSNRKKKNRDVEEWRFIRIVQCCSYFTSSNPKCATPVTLLTTDGLVNNNQQQQQQRTATGTRSSPAALDYCSRNGIAVESVIKLYKRWSSQSIT